MPGRLLLFCGIPGSGKTTIARLVARSDPNAVHIQTDAIRATIPLPTFSAEESDFVYETATEAAREALDKGSVVLFDATFGNRKRREKTLDALAGHYSRADFVFVTCDRRTALRRNAARAGLAAVPERVVMDMLSRFEEPPGALKVDNSGDRPEAAADEVARAFLYPLVPPE